MPDSTSIVSQMSFSWYDYLIFCLMLALSVVIGIYYGCFGTKQATANEYLMGNKKMTVFPISVSLIASHVSGITLLAVPADIYTFGATYWLIALAVVIVAVITAYIYLPVFYNLNVTSTYEYLERRFDQNTRTFASFLFTLGLFFYLPIVIYIPALALSATTQISVHYIAPVICGICIFYTTLGGLKAVVWTDTLQFTISTGAVVVVFVLGLRSAGGFGAVWAKAIEGQRLNVFDFDPDPTKRDSFWIVVIGFGTYWMSMAGINQTCVQKYLSVPTLRQARLSILLFSVGVIVVSSCSIFTGLIMYSKYADCDPFTSGAVQKSDQLLLYYIMDVASHIPGLSGLFIAGIFCAALSTLSAYLNCVAGTIYEDFILKFSALKVSKRSSTYILKLIVVIVGVICTALIFVMEHLGGILPLVIGFVGITGGPLLGMFSLGILHPRASRKGALYGSIVGLLCTLSISTVAQYYKSQGLFEYEPKPTSVEGCLVNVTKTAIFNSTRVNIEKMEEFQLFPLFRISYYYYSSVGCVVTILLGLIIDLIFKSGDPPVHPDLLSPLIRYFMNICRKCTHTEF